MHDSLAHEAEDLGHARDDVLLCADHEGEFAGCCADDAARHGRVDEAALAGAVGLGGDFFGGHGVDCAAVDEEAFLFDRSCCQEIVLF